MHGIAPSSIPTPSVARSTCPEGYFECIMHARARVVSYSSSGEPSIPSAVWRPIQPASASCCLSKHAMFPPLALPLSLVFDCMLGSPSIRSFIRPTHRPISAQDNQAFPNGERPRLYTSTYLYGILKSQWQLEVLSKKEDTRLRHAILGNYWLAFILVTGAGLGPAELGLLLNFDPCPPGDAPGAGAFVTHTTGRVDDWESSSVITANNRADISHAPQVRATRICECPDAQ